MRAPFHPFIIYSSACEYFSQHQHLYTSVSALLLEDGADFEEVLEQMRIL
jgi:hypothetical protein